MVISPSGIEASPFPSALYILFEYTSTKGKPSFNVMHIYNYIYIYILILYIYIHIYINLSFLAPCWRILHFLISLTSNRQALVSARAPAASEEIPGGSMWIPQDQRFQYWLMMVDKWLVMVSDG